MIALRPATDTDAQAIARVHVEAWHKAYDGRVPAAMGEAVSLETRLGMWQVLLGRYAASHPAIVAVDGKDGRIVGFAMVSRVAGDDEDALPAGELHMLFVAPGFQRRDLGRRLFRQALEVLAGLGCVSAMASVLETPQALGFFTAMGGGMLDSTSLDMPGAPVVQHLFAWPDLAAALHPSGSP